MSSKYVLRNACLLFVSPFLLSQCRDEFNDPNPRSNWLADEYPPFINLISPVDSGVYKQETLPIIFTVTDNFSLNSVKVEMVSNGKPAPRFDMNLNPGKKSLSVDTVYHSNVMDTLELQMLIFADDSSGNVSSKTITYWMIKP